MLHLSLEGRVIHNVWEKGKGILDRRGMEMKKGWGGGTEDMEAERMR